MGRTIPSFRIAAVLEEENWKLFRKYLRNKNEKKLFTHMFSTANLYNSACSNAVNPFRIQPIMMSIILHHYKMLKDQTYFRGSDNSSKDDHDNDNDDINDYNNTNSTILKQKLEKWYNFSFVLRKKSRFTCISTRNTKFNYKGKLFFKPVIGNIIISRLIHQRSDILSQGQKNRR
jgi:hypothetical protein